jgi:2-dehydropantoate 2-reductase
MGSIFTLFRPSAGSIGSLLAAHLQRLTPHQVRLILRPDAVKLIKPSLPDGRRPGTTKITIEREGVQETATDIEAEFPPGTSTLDTASAVSDDRKSDSYSGNVHVPTNISFSSNTPIESLFVTTKAYSVFNALRPHLHRITPHSTLIFVQNGMGVVEDVVNSFFPEPSSRPSFITASTTHGALVRDTHAHLGTKYAVWTGVGELVWAVYPNSRILANLPSLRSHASSEEENPLLNPSSVVPPDLNTHLPPHLSNATLRATLATLLSLSPLQPKWLSHPAFRTRQMVKLAINAVINPLTAILDVQNGALLFGSGSEHSQKLGQNVCFEASQCFAAELGESHPAVVHNRQTGHLDIRGDHPLAPEALFKAAETIMAKTSINVSSMLSDVRAGRDTEMYVVHAV